MAVKPIPLRSTTGTATTRAPIPCSASRWEAAHEICAAAERGSTARAISLCKVLRADWRELPARTGDAALILRLRHRKASRWQRFLNGSSVDESVPGTEPLWLKPGAARRNEIGVPHDQHAIDRGIPNRHIELQQDLVGVGLRTRVASSSHPRAGVRCGRSCPAGPVTPHDAKSVQNSLVSSFRRTTARMGTPDSQAFMSARSAVSTSKRSVCTQTKTACRSTTVE